MNNEIRTHFFAEYFFPKSDFMRVVGNNAENIFQTLFLMDSKYSQICVVFWEKRNESNPYTAVEFQNSHERPPSCMMSAQDSKKKTIEQVQNPSSGLQCLLLFFFVGDGMDEKGGISSSNILFLAVTFCIVDQIIPLSIILGHYFTHQADARTKPHSGSFQNFLYTHVLIGNKVCCSSSLTFLLTVECFFFHEN